MRTAAGLLILGLAMTGGAFAADAGGAGLAATAEGSAAPRLDVVFCVDTTGSMADEIEVVKQKMREMVAHIAAGKPTPDVRFGLVLYRDRGDEYVTKRYQLTRDVDEIVADIGAIVAAGGNDYPESVNEALHVAVEDIDWDRAAGVGRLLFLIGDAPPHMDYPHDYDYHTECGHAETRGIAISTIKCSGLEAADQKVFDRIADLTGGNSAQLTYRSEYAKADGTTEVVVEAGSKLYALGGGVGAADWREGADVLAGRGVAKAVTAPTGARGGVGMAAMPGVATGAAGPAGPVAAEALAAPAMPGAAGMPRPAVVAQTNNLDYLLTRQVQQQLAAQGVRFADQPYLARATWTGANCAQAERQAMVVRTPEEWQRVWALVAASQGKPVAPAVDFSRDMVLAVFGGQATAARPIRIADIWSDKDGLHVRVERGAEDPKARAPYQIIVITKSEGKVLWN